MKRVKLSWHRSFPCLDEALLLLWWFVVSSRSQLPVITVGTRHGQHSNSKGPGELLPRCTCMSTLSVSHTSDVMLEQLFLTLAQQPARPCTARPETCTGNGHCNSSSGGLAAPPWLLWEWTYILPSDKEPAADPAQRRCHLTSTATPTFSALCVV